MAAYWRDRFPVPRARILALLCVALLFAAVTYLLLKPRPRMAPVVPLLARAAQERAGSLVDVGTAWSARLDSESDRLRAFDRFLEPILAEAAGALDEGSLRSAFVTLFEFGAALGAAEPDGYASWAASRGHRPRADWPAEAGRDDAFYRRVYAELLGVAAPPNLGPEQFFADLFRLRAGAHAARPVAMLVGEQVIEVDLATFTHPADTFDYLDPVHPGGLGDEFWLGGSSAAGIRLWDPPRSLEEIIKAHGAARAMRVRCVLETADGRYLILIVELVHDPGLEQWHVHRLWQQNFRTVIPDRVPPPLY